MTICFVVFGAGVASATYIADITFDYTDNGGGNFTFDFTVYNNSTGTDNWPLMAFMIELDADASSSTGNPTDPSYSNYSNVTWLADNAWFSDAGDPDLSFGGTPAYVYADDYGVNNIGIAQGTSLGGFSVNFDYAGTLLPEDQLFTFYAWFDNIELNQSVNLTGTTSYVPGGDGVAPVPEPATLLLLGTGLAGLAGFSRKRKNR